MDEKYDFEESFQTKVLALYIKDANFAHIVDGLLKPEYFTTDAQAYICSLALNHYKEYGQPPSLQALVNTIKQHKKARKLDSETAKDVYDLVVKIYTTVSISDAKYVSDQVSEFAKRSSMKNATLKSAELLANGGDLTKLQGLWADALNVGTIDDVASFEYGASVSERVLRRKEPKRGIPTGYALLDNCLYHHGWGIGELSCIMGPAKSGKSMALSEFALNASKAGYNVLYVTLEVSAQITQDRMDANIAGIEINDLPGCGPRVVQAVEEYSQNSGKLIIYEYPSGTFSVSDFNRLINRLRAKSHKFDLIVVDYADIMRSDVKREVQRQELRDIYLGLRAIAQTEHCGVLTATQTNREGMKKQTSDMTHMSEDISKVWTVDLLISINRSENERRNNTLRLHFIASRNSESGFSLVCKSDMSKMKFITEVCEKI